MSYDVPLPAALQDRISSMSEQYVDPVIRGGGSVGIPRRRLRVTKAVEHITVTLVLPLDLAGTAKTFYEKTCRYGTRSIGMRHPQTDAPLVVCFAAPPQSAASGPMAVQIQWQLEVQV